MVQRRVGLSSRHNPGQLLGTVGGKKTQILKVPLAVDAPPLSSDESADELSLPVETIKQRQSVVKNDGVSARAKSLLEMSDSSADERPPRGDIKSTKFTAAAAPAALRSRAKRTAANAADGDDPESATSKKKLRGGHAAKTPFISSQELSAAPSSSGEHLRDERGFTKLKRSRITYKKKENSSQERAGKNEEKERSTKALRIPGNLQSPEPPKRSQILAPSQLSASPTKTRALRTDFVRKQEGKELSETGTKGDDVSEYINPLKAPRTRGRKKKTSEQRKSKTPPRPVFKTPAALSEVNFTSDKTKALQDGEVSDAESPEDEPDEAEEPEDAASSGKACPWCGETVDTELLQSFSKGKRLNVRQQSQFCRKHKKRSATNTWGQRGYPQIQWTSLHVRFAEHNDFLLGLVNGNTSHYRSIHADNIEKGTSRAMKSEDNLIPGYYGPRGFSLMSDYLVGQYGERLKERAVSDRVIAGRGSAAFIQSVLVAELAVRLIMDDMDVQEEEARSIMEESKRLGEIVNDEE